MGESDAPKSQDNTANHTDDPQDRGALGNGPPSVSGNPSAPSESDNPNRNTNTSPWWRRDLEVWKFLAEIFILVVTIRIAFIYAGQLEEMKKVTNSSEATISWIQNQTRQSFPRPTIWVKMPDTIQIDPDKPVQPDIQIFNYGSILGVARARIRLEKGVGVMNAWRDLLRNHQEEFGVPDEVGMLSVPINPLSGRRFSFEKKQDLILSKQDIEALKSGKLEVVFYGRIHYHDLNNTADGTRNQDYQSKFCFYVMRDGTTLSACPNETNKFANWAN